MNDIKWREERHLNVDGMNRIAQSMKKVDEYEIHFAKTHTQPNISVCVIEREKKPKK